jgi:hypothetical protein
MTTALDLVTRGLRSIGALEAGEVPSAQDGADSLAVLNDMLEQWSLEHLYVFSSTETVFSFTPGTFQYTVGNPVGGTFTGTLVSGSPTISGVTIPANLVAGGDLSDVNAAIPVGTTVLSFGAGTVTMSQNASSTVSTPEVITYTVPGNFKMPRPLRITNAFTRITASGTTQLDYQMAIIHRDQYTAIGIKGLPGPWPTSLYYDPTFPLGTLNFYPNPSQAGQLHLWSDLILQAFPSLATVLNAPQGYSIAIWKNLALQLAPEYGKSASALLVKQARDSKAVVKSLNAVPAVVAFFDRDIVRGRRPDAGWIVHGGFNT